MLEALPSWFSIFERDGKRDIPLFRLKQFKRMSGTRVKCILWQYDTLYKKIGESL